jgi:hypothetical protein
MPETRWINRNPRILPTEGGGGIWRGPSAAGAPPPEDKAAPPSDLPSATQEDGGEGRTTAGSGEG